MVHCTHINCAHGLILIACLVLSRSTWSNDLCSSWSLHMMTSSNGNIFRVTGPLCGDFTGDRWIPLTRPVTRSFDIFFDLHLKKLLSKQSWGWWLETPSRLLWRHCSDLDWGYYGITAVPCRDIILKDIGQLTWYLTTRLYNAGIVCVMMTSTESNIFRVLECIGIWNYWNCMSFYILIQRNMIYTPRCEL